MLSSTPPPPYREFLQSWYLPSLIHALEHGIGDIGTHNNRPRGKQIAQEYHRRFVVVLRVAAVHEASPQLQIVREAPHALELPGIVDAIGVVGGRIRARRIKRQSSQRKAGARRLT